ncbi:MAG: DUF370 domain-containing protein [Oscillospiraceae bacterium]|nr:DUF370 domain-containing protein [Oscillospiraceae bacterium]MDD4367395.1 DUF370 domain-containing protein [Oscillospiraceae bacterium]
MYVHIGGEYSLSEHLIVAILDLDQTTADPRDNTTLLFLQEAQAGGQLETVGPGLPRSAVVTVEKTYLTPVSAATIKQRQRSGSDYKNIKYIY